MDKQRGSGSLETAIFAGGCFWCTEAIFKRIKGVESAVSGYCGGKIENPTYEQVCSGNTGHAEAIQIKFDPKLISFEKLLEVFFKLHDPTTLNRQGNDVGTQYRSAIFYHDEKQKTQAQKAKLQMRIIYKGKIVTEIAPFSNFYKAENYHQNYFENNKNAPYCQVVINPKIQKLYKDFGKITKDD